jgi:hypothetical protein
MEVFIGWFQPLWLLQIKIIALVFSLGLIGWSAALLTDRSRSGDSPGFPIFLCCPLGFGIVFTVCFATLRVLVVTRCERFWLVSAAGAMAGMAFIGWASARRLLTLKALREARGKVLLQAFIVTFCTSLTLMPMWMEPELRYFAASGTDATGYTRAAKAMMDGWYFKPVPVQSFDDRLYRPGRPWTYYLMQIEDRPGAYGLVAIVSQWLRVNVLQAYMICGPLAVILFACLLASLLEISRLQLRWRFAIGVMALLLISASGLIANFYYQFFAQVISIATITAVAPAMGVWALRARFRIAAVLAAALGSSILVTYLYDARFVLMLAPALGASVALAGFLRDGRKAGALLSASAAVAGCALPPFLLHSWPRLLGPVPKFLDTTPLSAFIFTAGLGFANKATVALYVVIACALLGGLALLDRLFNRIRNLDPDGLRLFLFSFNLVVLSVALTNLLWMTWIGNAWAMKKTLYFVLPPLIVLSVHYLTLMSAASRVTIRAGMFSMAVILVAVVSLASLARQWEFANLILTKRWGTLTTETVRQLKEVQSHPGARVRLDVPILDFLQLVTILDDSGHAIFAPFSSWWHGSVFALERTDAQAIHKAVHTSPEATRPSPTFFFSEVATEDPTWRRYDLEFAANARDPSTRVIDFDVTFPGTAAGPEPLMTSGFNGDGFFIYVEYLPDHMARMKFNYWGSPELPVTPPFPVDGKLHHLNVTMRLGESVEITMDGELAISAKAPVRMDQTHHTTLGENRIGGGLTAMKFTGTIAPAGSPLNAAY